MGWSIILKDESGEIIASLGHEFDTSVRTRSGFKLLCYLDRYGDTMFNQLQMDDLVNDLKQLQKLEANPLIDEILLLAERCKHETHSYLFFYGD
jgi:hypothetical protein